MPYAEATSKGTGNSQAASRVAEVRERIDSAARRSGRTAEQIRLVAVSKGHSAEEIRAVHAVGVREFGENYAQELLVKSETLADCGLSWHFTGHLQSNKARAVCAVVDWIETLDGERLAAEVSARCGQLGRSVSCLLEVNVAGEDAKSGVAPEDAERLWRSVEALPGLAVRGLMGMAPWPSEESTARRAFAELRGLAERLRERGCDAAELSMGMSGDYEVAIEEGATIVRIGTAVFGAPVRN